MNKRCSGCGSEGFPKSILGSNRCTFCDGAEGGNPPVDCPQCKGTGGKLYYEPGLLTDWCKTCDGTGKVERD